MPPPAAGSSLPQSTAASPEGCVAPDARRPSAALAAPEYLRGEGPGARQPPVDVEAGHAAWADHCTKLLAPARAGAGGAVAARDGYALRYAVQHLTRARMWGARPAPPGAAPSRPRTTPPCPAPPPPDAAPPSAGAARRFAAAAASVVAAAGACFHARCYVGARCSSELAAAGPAAGAVAGG